jgi:hypothetical protein
VTELHPDIFPAFFTAVHGTPPFPWQTRLAHHVVATGFESEHSATDATMNKDACGANLGRLRRPCAVLERFGELVTVAAAGSEGPEYTEYWLSLAQVTMVGLLRHRPWREAVFCMVLISRQHLHRKSTSKSGRRSLCSSSDFCTEGADQQCRESGAKCAAATRRGQALGS